MRKLMSASLAALLVLLLPVAAHAQEEDAAGVEPQESCTATITPIYAAGQVTATATFDRPFGEVTKLVGPPDSGLKLVKLVEGERQEMAAEAEEAAADAAVEENTATFRIDASRATPGTYEVVLHDEAGATCTAELIVKESGSGDEW